MNAGKYIILRSKLNQISFTRNSITNINKIFGINQNEKLKKKKDARQTMINSQNESMTHSIRGSQVVLTSFDHKHRNNKLEKFLSDDLLSNLNGVPVSASITSNTYSEFEDEQSCEEDEQITDISIVEIENRGVYESLVKAFEQTFFVYRKHSFDEWKEIISKYGVFYNSINTDNMKFQGIIDFLLAKKFVNLSVKHLQAEPNWHQSELVQSFLEFILSPENIDSCQPSLRKYIRYCKDIEDYDEIIRIFKMFEGQLISPFFCRTICESLQNSKYLDECKKLERNMRKSLNVFTNTKAFQDEYNYLVNSLAICALRNDQLDTALQCVGSLLKASSGGKSKISFELFDKFLTKFRYTKDPIVWKRNKTVVESFLKLHSKTTNIFKSEDYAHRTVDWFKSIQNENWRASKFEISYLRKPFCPVTGVPLLPSDLTYHEFNHLKEIVLQVIMKKVFHNVHFDTMNKYSPAASQVYSDSLCRFLEFVMNHGPFDVIFDGLNILYSSSKRNYDGPDKFDKGFTNIVKIAQILKRLKKKPNLTILVPLRSHMKRHAEKHQYMLDSENIKICYVGNNISDDSVQLYAAICSGPNCFFASSDFFRDYKYLVRSYLGHEAGMLFLKYQRSRQIEITIQFSGKVYIGKPNVVDCVIQNTDNTWHLPYSDLSDPEMYANKWICVYK